MTNDELQSKVISFLRFPLIVGVVFTHNAGYILNVNGVEMGNIDAPICYTCSELFSLVIGKIPVRLFFFMSGFLFFLHAKFDKKVYTRKLKNRVWTLLIPYLFWNAAALLACYILHLMGKETSQISDYNLVNCLSAFWGLMNDAGTATFPIDIPFWFIRDLMMVAVISPIIYWFLKRTKIYGLAVIGLLWLFEISIPYIGIRGLSPTALFFFMAGAWFSINGKNLLEEFGKTGNWIYLVYIVIALADLCSKETDYNQYIHKFGILAGIVCSFKVGAYLVEKRGVKTSAFISSATFFVFAIHNPWILGNLKKLLYMLVRPESDGMLTVLYFGNVILTVCISLLIYSVLKRFLPRFTAIITGGR